MTDRMSEFDSRIANAKSPTELFQVMAELGQYEIEQETLTKAEKIKASRATTSDDPESGDE